MREPQWYIVIQVEIKNEEIIVTLSLRLTK